MTKTRLQKHLLRRVFTVVLVASVIVLTSSVVLMSWFYHERDVARIDASLTNATLLLHEHKVAIGKTVRDYAVWNDTYQYIQHPNDDYPNSNYRSESLDVMHVDFIALFDVQGRDLFSSQRNDQNPKIIQPIAAAQMRLIQQLPELVKGADNQEPKPKVYLTFYQNRPLILSICGVFDSQQEQDQNGFMVLGHYLDTDLLDDINSLAGAKFTFTLTPQVDKKSMFASSVSDSSRVDGWLFPEIYLTVQQDVKWTGRWLIMGSFGFSMLLVLFCAAIVLKKSLHTIVIARIENFAEIAWQRMLGKSVHWPVQGDDELDLLARSFNGLMDELSAAQKNLQVLSVTDALTTLGNRRSLEQEIELMLHNAGPRAECSMLLLDLDGFKLINDSLGHAAGDLLLQEVAQRMRLVMRRQDMLFRMGGDEFAVLMPNTLAEQATKMAERLLAQLIQPVHFGEHVLNISGSIGIAEWREGLTGMDLVRRADLAMYAAKRSGKARICLYEKGMSGEASARMVLEQALRQAIQKDEIEPFFQPVIDTDNGQVVALEMLARWWFKDDYVPPAEFIRLAEDLGLIHTLSAQLLAKGLKSFMQFRLVHPDLKLQINISPLQFADRHLARVILNQLEAADLPANALVVELTESATLLYPEQVEQTMRQFVEAGVSLHLDDFGTGYSSLARLRDLPFDTLKLDRSFVMMMARGDTALSKAVFDMATSMHMNLIAEGVENETEMAGLKALGYRRMQGFMFAEPMPAVEMQKWLSQHPTPDRHSSPKEPT